MVPQFETADSLEFNPVALYGRIAGEHRGFLLRIIVTALVSTAVGLLGFSIGESHAPSVVNHPVHVSLLSNLLGPVR